MNHRILGILPVTAIVLAACADVPVAAPPEAAPTLRDVSVVIPTDASPGLIAAANDFSDAVLAISGVRAPVVRSVDAAPNAPIVRVVRDKQLADDEQSYSVSVRGFDPTHYGLEVSAASDQGAMYGLYDVIADLGVRYHHPEEELMPPADADAALPWAYTGELDTPQFALRGFHEHTQHPIPLSDFYLRPEPEHRPYVSNYLRWLARNRQNVASFHMLKTVELDAWEPYIADIVDEAHGYGIEIGTVVSFVDEQQNNFRLIDAYPADDEEEQIRESMTRLAALGFDFFTLPVGSSEFTKPEDEAIVRWINAAADIAADLDPSPRLWTWVHISCSLKADDGSIYWHLPGEATPEVGAWVHTVMFHDLEHPAPVYDCEDFHHQVDFIEQEEDERPLVYFPETAWWLGFDNNLPLALPITGWTRSYDIQEVLPDHKIEGHVTFTSGREWTYWQYDHFLTQATWDDDVTWETYLRWIADMYGERGDAVVAALEAFTARQVQDFFETNPTIYFYLAGELRQDEIGAQAGILARRPKLPYREVIGYDDEEFAAWHANDYELLLEMRDAYGAIVDDLPAPSLPDGSNLSETLYFEVYATLDLFVKRIDQALALYGAVQDVREWVTKKQAGEVEGSAEHARLHAAATEKLQVARSITAAVTETIGEVEQLYRYPAEILWEPKPESPTSYPFGYLEETHTAHFWTRRDDQLETLIDDEFFERPDVWETEPDSLYSAESDDIELVRPENPFAADAILSFVPRLLFGLSGDDLRVGQDYNDNFIPDRGTETAMPLTREAATWTATTDIYTFIIRNSVGESLGEGLSIFDPEFAFEVTADVPTRGTMDGHVAKANLIALITDVGGIDPVGAERLLKRVFDVPTDEELPALLPFEFAFELTSQASP